MNLDGSVTVTKIALQNGRGYLMIGWQSNAFEICLYTKDNLWKGKFSTNRLAGFCKNLQITEHEYFSRLKQCLSKHRDDYRYELINGFFYWKRIQDGNVIIEGFVPMEIDPTPRNLRPDLIDVLLELNARLKEKENYLKCKFQSIKTDYLKCLKDTEEFLNLKIDMEKALCNKFLNLLILKNTNVEEQEPKNQNEAIVCEENIAKEL